MLRSAALVSILSSIALCEHLPANLIARGKTETILCGVDVYHSTLAGLKGRFGAPTRFEEYPKTEEAAEITWDKEGSIIHATINADHIAYAVELSGKLSSLAQTGSGLKLGQSLIDLRRIYGSRFPPKRQCSDTAMGERNGVESQAGGREDHLTSPHREGRIGRLSCECRGLQAGSDVSALTSVT